jgi:hypothetical protein
LTKSQITELGALVTSAGTTDALLDAVAKKADAFLASNDKVTKEAFAAGGFTPEP